MMINGERFNKWASLVEDALDEKDELLALRVEEAKRNFKKTGGIKFEP